MKPTFRKFSTHEFSLAGFHIKGSPRMFNPNESANDFVPGTKLIRDDLVRIRIVM